MTMEKARTNAIMKDFRFGIMSFHISRAVRRWREYSFHYSLSQQRSSVVMMIKKYDEFIRLFV